MRRDRIRSGVRSSSPLFGTRRPPPPRFTPNFCQAFPCGNRRKPKIPKHKKLADYLAESAILDIEKYRRARGSPRAPFLFAETFCRGSRAHTGPPAVRALTLPLFDNPAAPTTPAKRRREPQYPQPWPNSPGAAGKNSLRSHFQNVVRNALS